MVRSVVTSRYPNVKVILSHGGGFLPYAAYRFAGLTATMVDTSRNADELITEFRRFYFDTALSATPAALPALLAFAEPGHVLYGSDWPFAPPKSASTTTTTWRPTPATLPATNRGNAENLFPRLAKQRPQVTEVAAEPDP